MRMLDRLDPLWLNIVSITLFVVLMADVAVTLAGLISMNGKLGRAEEYIKSVKKEQIAKMDVHITAADERIEQIEQHAEGVASRVKESVYEHVGVHVDGARERMRDGRARRETARHLQLAAAQAPRRLPRDETGARQVGDRRNPRATCEIRQET